MNQEENKGRDENGRFLKGNQISVGYGRHTIFESHEELENKSLTDLERL